MIISIAEAESQIIPDFENDLPENLVGAAVLLLPDDTVPHAAIFLRHEGENKIFHYTGKDVEINEIVENNLYLFKELTFIDEELLPSMMAHCLVIEENADPKYGFFYDGSALYDDNGNFQSASNLPQFMTCVGFCLTVIKSFMPDDDFFNYEDWDETGIGKSQMFVSSFIDSVKTHYPDVDIEDFKRNLRRIFPIEYITGAYSGMLPVRKKFTDSLKPIILKALIHKKHSLS